MSEFWKRFSRNRSAVLGLVILILVIILACIASLLYPEDPFRLAGKPLSGPGLNGFFLGSDSLGRDVASGIAHGAKTSLMIGLIATLAAVFIGIIFGALSGYYGGFVDDLLMRITEIFQLTNEEGMVSRDAFFEFLHSDFDPSLAGAIVQIKDGFGLAVKY